jgi:uncharacterized protein YkwD
VKRSIVAVLGLLLLGAGLGTPAARASTSTDAVETRLLEVINEGRTGQGLGAEVMHAGLRFKTQDHSAYQASIDKLTHDGFSTRINTATPDPAESNGAPDDGFGAACENVAYFGGFGSMTTEQVAQKFYSMWFNSPGHHDCMFDAWGYGLNAVGVGVYQDSRGYWWATFESVRDSTPPAVSPPSPPGPTWTRIEQTSTNVVYTGTGWKSKGNKHASGRSYSQSAVADHAVTFTFTGTDVRVIGFTSSKGGIAEVRIDGSLVGSVDTYTSHKAYQKLVFAQSGLADTSHTIQVTVTGTKNPNAKGTNVTVDAFDYLP